jgi:predicted nucleotidyltransferase
MVGVEVLLEQIARWAGARRDIVGAALVGSHARGAAHAGSDIDIVLVIEDVAVYLSQDAWLASFGRVESVTDEDYGLVRARRARYAGGLEIEWGIADRRWLCTGPLDAPTASVVAAGMRVIHDPEGLLARLDRAVRGPGARTERRGRELIQPQRGCVEPGRARGSDSAERRNR